jgi:hypothetical protein
MTITDSTRPGVVTIAMTLTAIRSEKMNIMTLNMLEKG